MENDQESCKSCQQADVEGHAEGYCGIGNDAVHGKVDHLFHGKFGNARMTGRSGEFNAGLFEAQTAHDSANEAGMFPEFQECIEGFPVHEPEIRAPGDHGRIGNGIDHRIVAGRSQFLHETRIFRGSPDGLHDVVPFLPFFDEFGNEGRRMLHIAIHGNHHIAPGKIHAAGDGDLMTEIPGKGECPYMGVMGCQLMNQQVCLIPGTIVDVNQLIVHSQAFHDLRHFVMEEDHIIFFIVYGCHD